MSAGHRRQCLQIKLSNIGLAVSCFPVLVLLHLATDSSCLRLTKMKTPSIAELREDMELDCHFDMGKEELYAVKWYKDDHEFFRYMPRPTPNTKDFPVAGVHLDSQGSDCTETQCKVKLVNLTREQSGGAYRCEISSEAPAFRLASETHNITVAALPKQDPRIEIISPSLFEGETLTAKCISDVSDPAPILTWFINGQPASPNFVGEPETSPPDHHGLVYRSLSLHLPSDRKISSTDGLEIKCTSALPGLPLKPLFVKRKINLRSSNDINQINNEKLHWLSGDGITLQTDFFLLWTLLISVLRFFWSI